MSAVQEFLDRVVRPTVDDWLRNPLDERLAKQAANELNNLAERVFRHWPAGAPDVYGAVTIGEYRRKLVEHAASDFQLVWDIADAHKHVELHRPSRQVSRDDQTTPGCLGFGEGGFGVGAFDGPELVVRLDDGSRRALSGVISNVLAMWERIVPG